MNTVVAIDQYGVRHYVEGKYPRKELLHLLGKKRANKMYVGDGVHVGYVIGGLWLTVYKRMDAK